jgi:hypothetical protein
MDLRSGGCVGSFSATCEALELSTSAFSLDDLAALVGAAQREGGDGEEERTRLRLPVGVRFEFEAVGARLGRMLAFPAMPSDAETDVCLRRGMLA